MQTPNWREDFYKKFSYIQAIKNEASGNSYEKVIDFIATVEKESIERAIEVVEKLDKTPEGDDEERGYNIGLTDAKEALKTLLH